MDADRKQTGDTPGNHHGAALPRMRESILSRSDVAPAFAGVTAGYDSTSALDFSCRFNVEKPPPVPTTV